MATAYATVEDLSARWRDLDPSEEKRAEVLLEDAAVVIDSYTRGRAASVDALRVVSCNMVKRAMDADRSGVSQQTETAGPYSQTFTWANPNGDMYITKRERDMLVPKGRVGFFNPLAGGSDD